MATYNEYASFCQQIRVVGGQMYTAAEACADLDRLKSHFIILKHDVEASPDRALMIGKIETAHGIKATYYVHSFFLKQPESVAAFRQLQDMGHEIGYHFDVLDHNEGNLEKSITEFKEALNLFAQEGFDIRTTCPHGNPLKTRIGYSSNKDFFCSHEVQAQFPDIVDIYVSLPTLVEQPYLYVTDAQYSYLYRQAKITSTDETEEYQPLTGLGDIVKLVEQGKSMIVSTHSHRFVRTTITHLLRTATYRLAKKSALSLNKFRLGRSLINRFYYLAKKI